MGRVLWDLLFALGVFLFLLAVWGVCQWAYRLMNRTRCPGCGSQRRRPQYKGGWACIDCGRPGDDVRD